MNFSCQKKKTQCSHRTSRFCAPPGRLFSTEKLCWEVTHLPSPSHQKVTLHWHSSVLPQRTGAYSYFKGTTKSQKAQDKLGTLTKEYLTWVPWNSFASIQERLIEESLSENKKLSWASRKSGLPYERAWALQPTQKFSVVPRDQAVLEACKQSTARPLHYLLHPPNHPSSWGTDSSKHLHAGKHWRHKISACVQKVSSCNQWKKQQSSSWP